MYRQGWEPLSSLLSLLPNVHHQLEKILGLCSLTFIHEAIHISKPSHCLPVSLAVVTTCSYLVHFCVYWGIIYLFPPGCILGEAGDKAQCVHCGSYNPQYHTYHNNGIAHHHFPKKERGVWSCGVEGGGLPSASARAVLLFSVSPD